MKIFPTNKLFVLLLPFLGFFAGNLYAQGPVFTATAGAGKVGVEDQMELIYTIRNAGNIQSMEPGDLKDFKVVGGPFQSQSTQMSIVGNQRVQSTSVSITYIVVPRHTGNITIPPGLAKDADGTAFRSNPVTIQAVAGSVAPQRSRNDPFGDEGDPFAALRQQQAAMQQRRQGQNAGAQQPASPDNQIASSDLKQDIFIKVGVDKSKVYTGEQITTSYKLYARIPMQMGISKLPSLNGFWTQDFDIPHDPKPTEEIIDGKKYQVFLLKKSALFPQQTGTLQLDPAEAEGTARVMQKNQQRSPFGDMFDNDPFFRQAFGGSLMMNDPFFNNNFFSNYTYKDVPLNVKSAPVNITVMPLPEANKPEDYGGAVGDYKITGKWDKTFMSTDDAATLTVNISGSGNLKLFSAPNLVLPNGLSMYDPTITDTITGRSTTISGSKLIKYTVTATAPGDYNIPALSFTYFNPQSGKYTTLTTAAQTLRVSKGKHYKEQLASSNMPGDIHGPLNGESGNGSSSPLLYSPGYWSAYGAGCLAIMGLFFYRRRSDELSADTADNRFRKANKIALRRLSTAKSYLAQGAQKPFYEEVSRAVWLYLSNKLQISLAELSKETARAALASYNIPEAAVQELNLLVEDCEMALYSPHAGGQQMQDTYLRAVQLIGNLESHV